MNLRSSFVNRPGAWEPAHVYEEESETKFWIRGGEWSKADSLTAPPANTPLVCARLGNGQTLGIAAGGVYAAQPESP